MVSTFLPIPLPRLGTGPQSLPSDGSVAWEQRSRGALGSWGSSPGRQLTFWGARVACSLETEWCCCFLSSQSGGWSVWLVCGQVSEQGWDSQLGLTQPARALAAPTRFGRWRKLNPMWRFVYFPFAQPSQTWLCTGAREHYNWLKQAGVRQQGVLRTALNWSSHASPSRDHHSSKLQTHVSMCEWGPVFPELLIFVIKKTWIFMERNLPVF